MKNFLKGLFKKRQWGREPIQRDASEVWDSLSESEKEDLRYFQKLVYRGLKTNEDGTKKTGPSITVDGKVVARAKPGGTIKIEKNDISVYENNNVD